MDHHCPWINNCVGLYTLKHFLLFMVYVFLGTLYVLTFVGVRSVSCLLAPRRSCRELERLDLMLLVIISLFLNVLFCLFTVIMVGDQLWLMYTNTSTIDKIKRTPKKKRRGFWVKLKAAFGGDFSWRWFLPITIDTPLNIEHEYEY